MNDEDIHVMPSDGTDIIEHASSPQCECMPEVDSKTKYLPVKVYVHRLLREEAN